MYKLVKTMMMLLRIKKISTLIILVTTSMAITIGAVTIYSSQVGNFVVSIEPKPNVSLALSETGNFEDSTGRLNSKGVLNITNITYSDIDIDAIVEENGNANHSNRYLAYNFYLQNQSDVVVNYKITIEIDKVYKKVDSAIRVLVIKNKKDSKIYAKPQETEGNIGKPEMFPHETIPFKAPTKVMDEVETNFRDREIVKYTVIIWIEGEDAECNDSILNGSIKMSMNFAVIT